MSKVGVGLSSGEPSEKRAILANILIVGLVRGTAPEGPPKINDPWKL